MTTDKSIGLRFKAEGIGGETEHDKILFEKEKRCLTIFSTCCESDPRLAF